MTSTKTEHSQVVGVCLNGVQHQGDVQKDKEKLQHVSDENFKKIFLLIDELNEATDLFSMYRLDKLFDARILSVDSNYRGKGLGKEIIKYSENVAEKNHFQVSKT